MHYSESSQAEAGQQVDKLRHRNQPVPSALFSENPDPLSNPSNSQNFNVGMNEGNNDHIGSMNDPADDFFQQFANGQQDSAQPGVPATNNTPAVEENDTQIVENMDIPDNENDETDHNERSDNYEEDKQGDYMLSEEAKDHSNFHSQGAKISNQDKQGLEDEIRPNHQEESTNESNNFTSDNPYESYTRKNEQYSPPEKSETPGLDYLTKFTVGSRKASNSGSNAGPFGYSMQHRNREYGSFVGSTPSTPLTSAYLQLNHSRNSGNPSNSHTESVSSFPVTNYEDSEFMIQAYQRKKKAYEKTKSKLLQVESDLHLEKQRVKMFTEENKRLKLAYRKIEKKYKEQVQLNAKNEKEQLKRALELSNKERDLYKREREGLRGDNQNLRKQIQEVVTQNNMLKRQVSILEQQEDVSSDQKVDTIKEQLEYQVQRLKKELDIEGDKNKKWETYANELKVAKQKAESEKNIVMAELTKLRQQVKDLTDKNQHLQTENSNINSKWKICEEELSVLKDNQTKEEEENYDYYNQNQEDTTNQETEDSYNNYEEEMSYQIQEQDTSPQTSFHQPTQKQHWNNPESQEEHKAPPPLQPERK